MKLGYEEFKKAFAAEMMERMGGPQMEILEQQVSKVNRTLDALVFHRADSSIAPQIYLNDLYHEYEQGNDLSSIADKVVKSIEESMMLRPEIPELSHDYLEENLYLSLVNPELNQHYIEDVPLERLEDLVVVPRIRVNDEASIVVKDWMLKEYGFSKESLFKAARANMEKQDYRCMSLNAMLGGYGLETPGPTEPSEKIYVLTNMSSIDGAAAILSEKAMVDARQMIGEDFFILPSSRHEVILIPRSFDMSVADMEEMVKHANRTVVSAGDLLSDHVYRYNSSKGAIKMVEPKESVPVKEQTIEPSI